MRLKEIWEKPDEGINWIEIEAVGTGLFPYSFSCPCIFYKTNKKAIRPSYKIYNLLFIWLFFYFYVLSFHPAINAGFSSFSIIPTCLMKTNPTQAFILFMFLFYFLSLQPKPNSNGSTHTTFLLCIFFWSAIISLYLCSRATI